jgi:hypothetical protein
LKITTTLQEMHEGVGGECFSSKITIHKILDAKYWWPTMHKDVLQYCQACDNYQQIGNLIQRCSNYQNRHQKFTGQANQGKGKRKGGERLLKNRSIESTR